MNWTKRFAGSAWAPDTTAHETISLTFAFDVTGADPWFDTDYSPGFQLDPMQSERQATEEDGPSRPAGSTTVKKAVRLFAPRPLVTRQLAAKIEMTTEPAPAPPFKLKHSPFHFPASTTVKPATPVELVGRLLPPEPGKSILVRVTGSSFRGTKLATTVLGPVTTDESGQFRVSGWAPAIRGAYAASPSYLAQPGDLLADTMCPIRIFAESSSTR